MLVLICTDSHQPRARNEMRPVVRLLDFTKGMVTMRFGARFDKSCYTPATLMMILHVLAGGQ